MPGIFGIFGFLPVEPLGFLSNFFRFGSQDVQQAQHSQQEQH
jgi:hypothetical protein